MGRFQKYVFFLVGFLSLLFSSQGTAEVLDITSTVFFGESSPQIQNPGDVEFHKNTKSEINLGYSSQDQWFQVDVHNESYERIEKILYFDSPLIGHLTLLKKDSYRDPVHGGTTIPWVERVYPSRLGAFKLNLEAQESARYYIKRSSPHALSTRIYLADERDFEKNEGYAKVIFFFYFGGILSLIIYNFLLGIFTRYKDYLSYALFAASFGATALVIHGVFDSYLFRNPVINFSQSLMFFSSLTLLSAGLFVRRFLSLNNHKEFKVGYWGAHLINAAALVTLLASSFAPSIKEFFFFGYWIDIAIVLGILFFIYCGLYSYFKLGNKLASFFLLSWFIVLIGTFVWFLSFHGFIHSTAFTQYSLLLANLGEMLVLSLGLAYKIRILDEEKSMAERAAEGRDRYHRLVRVLSHDVSNTVSGLVLHSEMLKEHCPAQGPQRMHVDHLLNSTNQLTQILDSVRKEEVLQTFKNSFELKPVDLLESCKDALKNISWLINKKNIQVKLNVPEGKIVWADRYALVNQVLVNVISNSVKFSDHGQPLHLEIREGSQELILNIIDFGVGIPQEEVNHLFKGTRLFSKQGTSNESGTGLGTYLVAEYMKLFGGKIDVTSKARSHSVDSGTTVSLQFKKASS